MANVTEKPIDSPNAEQDEDDVPEPVEPDDGQDPHGHQRPLHDKHPD